MPFQGLEQTTSSTGGFDYCEQSGRWLYRRIWQTAHALVCGRCVQGDYRSLARGTTGFSGRGNLRKKLSIQASGEANC